MQQPTDDDTADLLAPFRLYGPAILWDTHVQGTNEGLDTARARGARLGRPPAMTPEQVRHARDSLTRPGNTVTSIAKLLGVSRNTIYNYVPEPKGGRQALAEATNTAELPRQARPKD
ncbi:helix-turn-helix domain-containing protein [Streptomyces sp. NPDC006510]|uniref:helix-turn-helix domain-containing protein n=1 Tax=Streptomyces sp. NPDC006510 TaxID=3155600 RepID=UPI00339E5D89